MLGDSLRRRIRGGGDWWDDGFPWSRWILGAALAVVLSFGTGYVVAVELLFPAADGGGEGSVPAPRLVGRPLADAEGDLRAHGLTIGEAVELPHPDQHAGIILAQTPLPGQHIRPGGEIRVAVSVGPARAVVPDVVGLPFSEAVSLIQRLGFEVNRRDEPATGPAGMVIRMGPGPGSEHELPASVTLVVSQAAEPPPPPDTGLVDPFGATSAQPWQ